MTTIEWLDWIAFALITVAFWLFLATAIANGQAGWAAFLSPMALISSLIVGAKVALFMGWLT